MAARDIDNYPGPRPYPSTAPFDAAGRLTYRNFFNNDAPPPSLAPAGGFAYQPGHAVNSEAQHPPLYYLLLAPFYRLAKGSSWPGMFLVLRLVSWLLAA